METLSLFSRFQPALNSLNICCCALAFSEIQILLTCFPPVTHVDGYLPLCRWSRALTVMLLTWCGTQHSFSSLGFWIFSRYQQQDIRPLFWGHLVCLFSNLKSCWLQSLSFKSWKRQLNSRVVQPRGEHLNNYLHFLIDTFSAEAAELKQEISAQQKRVTKSRKSSSS